jgi:hypothetical protein
VAVKLLREEYVTDTTLVARFNRETCAVAALSAPNTVDVYGYGQYQNTFFIVMQYIEGKDLKRLLVEKGAFPLDYAIRLVNEILFLTGRIPFCEYQTAILAWMGKTIIDWGEMRIPITQNVLQNSTNTLTLRNNTAWFGYLGIPCLLINKISFSLQGS